MNALILSDFSYEIWRESVEAFNFYTNLNLKKFLLDVNAKPSLLECQHTP